MPVVAVLTAITATRFGTDFAAARTVPVVPPTDVRAAVVELDASQVVSAVAGGTAAAPAAALLACVDTRAERFAATVAAHWADGARQDAADAAMPVERAVMDVPTPAEDVVDVPMRVMVAAVATTWDAAVEDSALRSKRWPKSFAHGCPVVPGQAGDRWTPAASRTDSATPGLTTTTSINGSRNHSRRLPHSRLLPETRTVAPSTSPPLPRWVRRCTRVRSWARS